MDAEAEIVLEGTGAEPVPVGPALPETLEE